MYMFIVRVGFLMAMYHKLLERYFKIIRRGTNSHSTLPEKRRDRIKYFFWNTYAPAHPHVRNSLMACKLIRHSGRQPFLLGHLAPQVSLKSFIEKVEAVGYHTHLLAWKDDDEILNLRLSDGFTHQYHLRVFDDGEVRGHYEYAPEAYPIAHLARVHFLDARDFFMQQLQEYIVPAYEPPKKDKPFLVYTRAFICFLYRRKRQRE